jgi:predicted ester cyclase
MSIEENKQIACRFQEGQWNDRDPEVISELMVPGTLLDSRTHEQHKDWLRANYKIFPDVRLHILEMVAEGDKVMIYRMERLSLRRM